LLVPFGDECDLYQATVPFAIIAVATAPAALVAAEILHPLIEAPATRLGRALTQRPLSQLGEAGAAD
jgi:peptidoglycan/LPS O-acetylase OafA/YrhL